MNKPSSFSETIRGLIQLSRWQEHVAFVIPLTVLGALLAVQSGNGETGLDWRLVAVTLANILAVAYAFMINDIEDAPDDALDPARAARNPVTSGRVSVRMGYYACRLIAVLTLVFYAFGGTLVFITGAATLLLSHLYSWRPVRLKAWPVTDVLSHSLMLSGLLLLAGYFLYHTAPGIVWFVAAAVTFYSVYGQLYNQIRDYDMDKAAGLKNTAILLGEANTRRATYLVVGLSAACLLAAIVQGVFPLWLGLALLVSVAISTLFKPQGDMRGGEAIDFGGKIQVQGLIAVNLTIGAWLVTVLAAQLF